MDISVVIPLYNKERHIARAITSVLHQTHQNFEIIVVDDGSTDLGVGEAQKLTDPRIRLIRQANSGVSAARNRGITEARYELIAFLDADDEWEPDFLETIVRLRKKYPQAGAYATAYQFKQPNGDVVPAKYTSLPVGDWEGIVQSYFKSSLRNGLIWTSAVAISKEVFRQIDGFPVGMVRGEDLNMWCRVALSYPIAFSRKVCATYHREADNRIGTQKYSLHGSFANEAADFYDRYKGMQTDAYFSEYMIKVVFLKVKYLIANGDRKEARKLLNTYSHTRCNQRLYLKLLMMSFLPKSVVNRILAR